jgi:heptosyltransferase II
MRERILVRAPNWVGDLVMALPAIEGIRASCPNAEITVMVKPPLEELLLGNPAVDHIFSFDKKKDYDGPSGIARLIKEIRVKKFTRAILLQNAFEAAVIAFLAMVPEREGYATDGRGMMLTRGVKVSRETKKKHQIYYYLDLLEKLGMKPAGEKPRLYLLDSDRQYADVLLDESGAGGPIIGINPGAQYGAAKKWHPERFGAVADKLAQEYGATVLIFGGPGDAGPAAAVQASMKAAAVNLAGKTSLRGLMSLIARCSLFITNDTGPMHIASALDVPTLAVFGSTNAAATGPYSSNRRVVREPVNCSPCLKRTCPLKHYRCMEKVSVPMVLEAARSMLEGRDG